MIYWMKLVIYNSSAFHVHAQTTVLGGSSAADPCDLVGVRNPQGIVF
jgi:hypothetical protein